MQRNQTETRPRNPPFIRLLRATRGERPRFDRWNKQKQTRTRGFAGGLTTATRRFIMSAAARGTVHVGIRRTTRCKVGISIPIAKIMCSYRISACCGVNSLEAFGPRRNYGMAPRSASHVTLRPIIRAMSVRATLVLLISSHLQPSWLPRSLSPPSA